MVDSDETDDGELSDEEHRRVARLTPAEIDEIDAMLLSNVPERYRKVAFVIAKTMSQHERGLELGIPDIFYSGRVHALVERGLIESVGNLRRMRFSEVRRRVPAADP